MFRSSAKPKKYDEQFADASDEARAIPLPNSGAVPSSNSNVETSESDGVSRKFQYFESIGFDVKPEGRGHMINMMRRQCRDLEDLEVKEQLDECPETKATQSNDSWLKRPAELEEDRKKWVDLLNSAKMSVPSFSSVSKCAGEDNDDSGYIPYPNTGAENNFTWKEEDFPPL